MSNLFKISQVYKPFNYPYAVDLTKQHEKIHWVEEEADLLDDVADWKSGRVTLEEKNFITQILRLFTQSDVAVGQFYYDNLIPKFLNNEVRIMLGSFANREGVHQRAYALLNDTLGLPDSEYHAFLAYTAMTEKHEHMVDADVSTLPGLMRALAKGISNEGISLFASFAMLLNFQRLGKMKGMGKIVEWSQRDEGIHVLGLAYLFRQIATETPSVVTDDLKRAIYDMLRETVRLEDAFVDLAFELGGIQNLTAAEVKEYIRFIADRRLTQMGLKENWGVVKNPLPWVDWLVAGADHTNFFEGKVTQYEVGSLTGEWSYPEDDAVREGWVIYTRSDCPYCVEAKALLAKQGLPVITIDLSEHDRRQAFFKNRGFTGKTGPYGNTMPKIYEIVNVRHILVGGYEELKKALT
jgi:glutaredoxin 3